MLSDVLEGVDVLELRGDPATSIGTVSHDSRAVTPQALFCCVPGTVSDGHEFAARAVDGGASALLCEHFVDVAVPQARVAINGVRPSMARAAANFWGHPASALDMVGVTGTNGKTTVVHLVRSILEAAGRSTGLVGTLQGLRTTPESPELQAILAQFVAEGRSAAALEVSSHALTQHRVDDIVFDVAAFTNLSRDHLDHHVTMEAYFEAKSSLFAVGRCRHAVVWTESEWGARLAESVGHRLVPVDRSEATDLVMTTEGTTFRWRGRTVRLPLAGLFNVDNALVAAAVASTLEVADETIVDGLSSVPLVPGRMEVVGASLPVSGVVDYAHTPDGLAEALRAVRQMTAGGRVVCVFGCGGDRDSGKRPQMGRVAAEMADVVVVTSDNPRSEDPATIIADIVAGMASTVPRVEQDRSRAIELAVSLAGPGDVVLVAGKGHETTQTIGTDVVAFDDRWELGAALGRRFGEPLP